MSEFFKAGVQYDDWTGSVAADELDRGGARDLFGSLVGKDEFIVGFRLWVGENHPGRPAQPRLIGFAAKAESYDTVKDYLSSSSKPVRLRRVEKDVSAEEFVLLFKRLEIMAVWKGLPLHNEDFEEVERW